LVSRTGSVPSTSIRQIRNGSPEDPLENASWVPSGDHVGSASVVPSAEVMLRSFSPFASITQMSPARWNAICRPSGDTAGPKVAPLVVTWVWSLPSGFIVQTLKPRSKAIRPFGPG
jgi:hypothetical protein